MSQSSSADQVGMFDEEFEVPAAVIHYLTGFTTRYLFGDTPTAHQKRIATGLAVDYAGRLASVRAQTEGRGQ